MDSDLHLAHYILTRFNISIFRADKQGKEVADDAWTSQRIALFERYCLPSVRNQSVQDFEWICLFDEHSPQALRQRIAQWQQQVPQLRPCFLSHDEALRYVHYFQRYIFQQLTQQGRPMALLATTYLDNDDLLHRDYLQQAQAYARAATQPTVITFSRGLQCFEQLQLATEINYYNNHFLTLVERFRQGRMPTTVIALGHYFLRQCPIHVLNDTTHRGYWVELIHGQNVDNDVKMRTWHRLHRFSNALRDYGADLPNATRAQFLRRFPPRWLRQALRRGWNKIARKPLPYLKE